MVHHPQSNAPRHWGLISLAILLTAIEAGALAHLAQMPPELTTQISLNMPLEMLAAGVWALLFAVITVNLLQKQAVRLAIWIFSSFLVYSVGRLLLFVRADYDQNRLPFLVVTALCLLIFPAVALLRRRANGVNKWL